MPGLKHSILILSLAVPVFGQSTVETDLQDLRPVDLRTTDLQPVDAFVADTSVLSTSLMAVQFSLQQSYGFEQLMRSDALGGQYVRRAGGLWSVSPSSTYMPTRSGYVPTIAPGTVFHIGDLPRQAPGGETGLQARTEDPSMESPAVDAARLVVRDTEGIRSLSRAQAPPAVAEEVLDKEGAVRFLQDEGYRRQVMLSLVWRATGDEEEEDQAARGPSSSDSK
ncbi:MAG: hypothetical protein CMJ36_01280 [Phycisphaerae bacterium]|nr:hypothetical protein [Phycisphaerae bacterium]